MAAADASASSSTGVERRPPETVMRLARMGSFHQTRLSFMRVLLRRLRREDWRYERRLWQVDETGVAHRIPTGELSRVASGRPVG